MTDSRTLTIDQLCRSPFNVRTHDEDINATEAIEDSIVGREEDGKRGLIHPLVVHPMRGSKTKFGVHAGARRYLAIKRAIERGALPADYPIPVEVTDYSEEALLELSLTENMLRRPMRAYEEFAAVKKIAARGVPPKGIARHLGQTLRWVEQHLRLGNLAPEIFEAFKNDVISLELAKAYAATEDHELQLHAWKQLSPLDKWRHTAQTIRACMAIGDREAAKLMRFVGREAYQDAGGRFELDLFADEADQRGRVVDEGILRQLVDAKLDAQRAKIRRRAGRDIRFVKSAPQNDFRMDDRNLAIFPADGALSEDDEAMLKRLKEENLALEVESWKFRDQTTGAVLEGKQPEIDRINATFDPNDARIEALEAMRPILLPDGDVVAVLEIQEDGSTDLSWWWASKRAREEAASPERKKAVAAKPAPSKKKVDASAVPDGAAIGDTYSYQQKADAVIKDEEGLTADGVQIFRSLRRANLATLLVFDAMQGGTVGGDYLVWAQLRMLLTGTRSSGTGMKALTQPDHDGDAAKAHLKVQPGAQALAGEREAMARRDFIAEADLVKAFLSYRAVDDRTKRIAAAIVAGFALERSLSARGYRIPVHDAVAGEMGLAGDEAVRDVCVPTADLLNQLPKLQRLAISEPLVEPDEQRSLIKAGSAELTAAVLKLVEAEAGWVHPLLRFSPTVAEVPALEEAVA